MAGSVLIRIRDEEFEAYAERALLWRSRGVLLVSDLHWGREQFMQGRGIPIPDVTLDQEIARLSQVISKSGARELWILGDWIHHPAGMGERVVRMMREWISHQTEAELKIRFVPGNHDRKILEWLGNAPVEVRKEGILCSGFRFDHDETNRGIGGDFLICGHLHPAVVLRSAVDSLKLPCLWVRKDIAYLPAFSCLAGGAVIQPKLPDDRVIVLTEHDAVSLY